MVNQKKPRFAGVAVLCAALLVSAAPASAITVDGDLTDLITTVNSIIGSGSPYNAATGTDPLGSADTAPTESNNGFDIREVYAHYNRDVDTLYLGMNFYGTVGDSLNDASTAACERTMPSSICTLPNYSRSIFDGNETYRFGVYQGTDATGPNLLQVTVTGVETSNGDTANELTNPFGLTVTRAISESFNGVEFAITGLVTNGALAGMPDDLYLFFGAGSADPNPVSQGAEDTYYLNMQVIPVPAAVWLFGTGLAALAGVASRRGPRTRQ